MHSAQVPFFVVKFLIFGEVTSYLNSAFAAFATPGSLASSVLIPLAAGAVAGFAAVLISQPADVVLTKISEEGGDRRNRPPAPISSVIAELLSEPEQVFSGLAPRLLFGMALVGLQFLLYSQLRAAFGIAPADLTQMWDPLASISTV